MPLSEWRPWGLLGVSSLLLFMISAATFSSLGVVLKALSQTCLVRDHAGGLPTCHSFAGGEVQKPV